MVEISKSGSGEGPGEVTTRGYSTVTSNVPDQVRLWDQKKHLETAGRPGPFLDG